jgi:CRISPR-associated protein Cas2
MMVLVTYDVSVSTAGGPRRLRRVAKLCRDFGQRVQFSVFEIEVDPAQWVALKTRLEAVIDFKTDSLRYYFLGANWQGRIEHVGAKPADDLHGSLIV